MKRVKSFAKIIIALLMALTLMTLTACDVLDNFFGKGGEEGGTGDGNVYNVAFENNGGTFTDSITEYTSGTAVDLPKNGTKAHYTFEGWYEDSSFSGSKVTKIPTGATGDKIYYARWSANSYTVTFYIDNAEYQADFSSYTYGTAVDLPKPTKSGKSFNGWYAESDLNGSKVDKITDSEYGPKTFYGSWVDQSSTVTKSEVKLNTNGGTLKSPLTEYEEGKETALPEITRADYDFSGWYTNAQCTGNPVTSIPASAHGKQEFWAGWRALSSDTLSITASAGYEEGAYVEFNTVSGISSYSVGYKTKGSSNNYQTIDSELVRVNNATGTVRADVVGLAKGNYTLQVIAGSQTKTTDVSVTNYDRSGYAHFNYTSGIGGYNDDGTPKSGANIVYVTEANKNSSFTVNGKTYSNIVKVLQDAKNLKPLIVRVIGTVGAATWEKIEYTKPSSGNLSGAEVINQTKELKGITLSLQSYTQAQLAALGFKYDTSKYSQLKDLEGKMIKDGTEFDSCWNNLEILSAQNVTLEGIGSDACIAQWGITWKACKSIEVRNLTFTDYTEDACSFEGSTGTTAVDSFTCMRIWMHHNTFNIGKNNWDVCGEQDKHDGDGATDFKGVSYVTIAYNRYNETHKTGLVGGGSSHMSANITFHHNYYNSCSQRLPLARQANMHMYNNYYHNSSTSLSLRSSAYAFIEYCYFDGSNNTMIEIQSYDASKTNTYAVAKVYNCYMGGNKYNYDKMPPSEMPSDKSKAHEPYIYLNAARTANIANNCTFCDSTKCFDIDSTKFYYDSTNQCSKVTDLITNVSSIPTAIPACAGAGVGKK